MTFLLRIIIMQTSPLVTLVNGRICKVKVEYKEHCVRLYGEFPSYYLFESCELVVVLNKPWMNEL